MLFHQRTAEDILQQRQAQADRQQQQLREQQLKMQSAALVRPVAPAAPPKVRTPVFECIEQTNESGSITSLCHSFAFVFQPPKQSSIRIKLPSGATIQRQFMASSTLSEVVAWILTSSGRDFGVQGPVDDNLIAVFGATFKLISTAPHRVFTSNHFSLTLQDAGLVPQGALRVSLD